MQLRAIGAGRTVRWIIGAGVLALVASGCGIVRVSVSSSGAEANAGSTEVLGVSDDGRYSLFVSYADNLVPGDTNGNHDVFRRDTETKATVRVDVATNGAQISQGSYDGALSSDGQYAVFVTEAGLDPADTNATTDVYLRNLTNNTTTWVSQPPAGGFGPGDIQNPGRDHGMAISADHRYVSFLRQGVAFPPNTTLYRRDLQTGVTTALNDGGYNLGMLVSGDARHYVVHTTCFQGGCFPKSRLLDTDGSAAGWPALPWADCAFEHIDAMSANGRFLAWRSAGGLPAPCLAAGFYLVDRVTGVASQLTPLEVPFNGVEHAATTVEGVSRDGTALIFLADGSFLPGGTEGRSDLYLRDLVKHADARLNLSTVGTESNADVQNAVLSDVGHEVGFTSDASDLVPNDHNGFFTDVFVRPISLPAPPP